MRVWKCEGHDTGSSPGQVHFSQTTYIRLLREPALTLEQILAIARAMEAADLQAEKMEVSNKQPPPINAITKRRTGYSRNRD